MQSYSKNEAIDRINKLAKTGKAFLFIINYKQDCSFVEQIDNILEHGGRPQYRLYNIKLRSILYAEIFWEEIVF